MITHDTLTAQLDRLAPALRETLVSHFVATFEDLAGRTSQNFINAGNVVTGALKKVEPMHRVVGDVFVAGVQSMAPYGAYVEFGTRPHWPPIRPIFKWVEAKLDVVGYVFENEKGERLKQAKAVSQFARKKGEYMPSSAVWKPGMAMMPKRRTTTDTTRQRNMRIYRIARLIQFKIARKGTKGSFAMRQALDSLFIRYQVLTQPDGGRVYEIDAASIVQMLGGRVWGEIKRQLR